VDELIDGVHQLKVRVLKKDGYWVGLSDDLAGGSTGDTLPELRQLSALSQAVTPAVAVGSVQVVGFRAVV
jgi:hypothetical protein